VAICLATIGKSQKRMNLVCEARREPTTKVRRRFLALVHSIAMAGAIHRHLRNGSRMRDSYRIVSSTGHTIRLRPGDGRAPMRIRGTSRATSSAAAASPAFSFPFYIAFTFPPTPTP
jgi:hypothetical protein